MDTKAAACPSKRGYSPVLLAHPVYIEKSRRTSVATELRHRQLSRIQMDLRAVYVYG